MVDQNERHPPLSDEVFIHQVTEGLGSILREITARKKHGNMLPETIRDIDFAEPISSGMSDEARVELINRQRALFQKGISQIPEFFGKSPRTIRLQGTTADGQEFEAFVTRLHEAMAFVDYIYLGKNGRYLQYRPMVWTGKDGINNFLRRQVPDNQRFFTAYR